MSIARNQTAVSLVGVSNLDARVYCLVVSASARSVVCNKSH